MHTFGKIMPDLGRDPNCITVQTVFRIVLVQDGVRCGGVSSVRNRVRLPYLMRYRTGLRTVPVRGAVGVSTAHGAHTTR